MRARAGPLTQVMHCGEIRLASPLRNVSKIVCEQNAVYLTPGLRRLVEFDRNSRRTFCQGCGRGVPGEGPAPIHADFIVWIDYISRAKLAARDFVRLLGNANC